MIRRPDLLVHAFHQLLHGSEIDTTVSVAQRSDGESCAAHPRLQIQRSVWHMLESHRPAMPHFRGTLSEADVRAIIEYLRAQRR